MLPSITTLICAAGLESSSTLLLLAVSYALGRVVKPRDSRARALKHLHYAALHDSLTELPNRRAFVELVSHANERKQQDSRTAVILFDLDRFKTINDSLGHHAGDQVLGEISRRLRFWARDAGDSTESLRQIGLARVSGDEFGVILEGIAPNTDVTTISEKLRRCLETPINLNGLALHVTISLGIVIGDITHADARDLVRDAAIAMHHAKISGGARCQLFDRHMRDQVGIRLQLENDLRAAICRREFRVVYQPIVELESGRVNGFEALVRWEHPERGIVSPDSFIPVAEQTGLILPIGEFVLRESLNRLAELHRQFPDAELSMSVNLSKRQLVEEGLVESIAEILRQSGIEPRFLKLEVTESVVMEHAEAVTPILLRLKNLGVHLAMDDFGTGHSSLSCLHQFPVDSLKIDRAFVNTMGQNRQYAAIVHAIVTLAHNLGMTVVSEGIETADQLILLQSLDCDLGQGYFFSKPLPANATAAVVSTAISFKRAG